MGYVAFPPSAKYVNAKQQERTSTKAAWPGPGVCQRTPDTELLSGATRRAADITVDKEHVLDLGGVRVRLLMVGPTHTKGDTWRSWRGRRAVRGRRGDEQLFVSANANSSIRLVGRLRHVRRHEADEYRARARRYRSGSILQALQTAVLGIQARARELKAQGKTADETATTVQKEYQAKHPRGRVNGVAALARSRTPKPPRAPQRIGKHAPGTPPETPARETEVCAVPECNVLDTLPSFVPDCEGVRTCAAPHLQAGRAGLLALVRHRVRPRQARAPSRVSSPTRRQRRPRRHGHGANTRPREPLAGYGG